MNILAEILSSKIRAEIFRLLFVTSAEELHMREIERCSGYVIGTIQTELKKLLRLDLVKKRKDGNRLYYRANKEHPLYPDIRSLVLKTIGLADILKNALRQDSDISIAFVFGSIALHKETAGSDVDLMVIGKLGLRKLTGMLSGVPEQIGREINPHVLSAYEFIKRKANREHFITQVLEAPKIFIIGTANDLEAMDG
jgi:DNA-binding transcriptional ArsR family regulator